MTVWQSLYAQKEIVRSLHIEAGELIYYRPSGAITRVVVDELARVELRQIKNQMYWYLLDQSGAFALIPETCTQIGSLRRYLTPFHGFNYDGLLRFEPSTDQRLLLWSLADRRAA
jgi:hypothetical protein|tara:strand:- start:6 stop:350 length:345 start_codon:yes stop_codon:yes gene_type:complete